MKTIRRILLCGLMLAASLYIVHAQYGPGSEPTNIVLQSWSFSDSTYWTDDAGYAPVSFTNIAYSNLGYGQTLVVDTNIPTWLKYNVVENDGTTNLTIRQGTLTFWFAAGSWASTNAGGVGPGEYGRLLEVGNYTDNSSYGLWSIYVDSGGNNLYFSAQTNDSSSNLTTYVCAPISWTTNDFHFVALTYSATNTTLYLDGVLATNGPGVTVYPGLNVLTNGFCIGSDTNGIYQAHGLFDLVQTYNYPLDSNDVQTIFNWYYPNFAIDPNNAEYMEGASLDSFSLSTTTNLAISPLTFSNNTASLFVVNSTADVTYEVQGCTNLAQRNWFTEGFVLGSQLTNWTWANFYVSKKGDLFLRVRSWQSPDGSGLPLWWESEYFGTNTVNPNAQDSAGDGWTIYQKFQMGLNPDVPTTPPAPQGLTAVYNISSGTATVSWLQSPGPVTGYTVTDSDGNTFNVSATTTSLSDNISSDAPDPWNEGNLDTTVQIEAHYGSITSPWSSSVSVEMNTIIGSIVAGPQGTAYLAVSALPLNTAAIRLTEIDEYYLYFIDTITSNAFTTNFDVPIGSFTNGLCQLPNNLVPNGGSYRHDWRYNWYAQAVGTNGVGLTATTWLTQDYNSPQDGYTNSWLVPPFFDGRTQLKQNLVFQLRAAVADRPFQYTELLSGGTSTGYFITSPTNYAYAGYYYFSPYDSRELQFEPDLDTFLPFEENYFDRNFVLDTSYLDSNGRTTTGVGGQYNSDGSGGLTIQTTANDPADYLELPVAFEFVAPTTNGATISSVLATNQTRWLSTYPVDSTNDDLSEIGITNEYTYSPQINVMFSNARNWFGLTNLSAEIGFAGPSTTTLYAGGNTTQSGYFYPETAQPQFQIEGYDWRIAPNPYYDIFTNGTDYPGMGGLSITHTNPVLITSVGSSGFQAACYAKLAVQNGYSGVYGYLQQYFDQAYQVDANGNVTTNTTGVLSPYGQFFATQPGPAALVTMPDLDTGQRGTNIVYAISLGLDVHHDGMIDTSFSGPDNTTVSSPYIFWANNNYDRWTPDEDDETNYMDDVQIANCPYTPNTATADCNYQDQYGNRVIPDTRDLEDYARLWVAGIDSHLLTNLPAGSTVTLNWGDVGNPNQSNPTIDLFQASDADGGMEYLTNETAAANQINPVYSAYVGRVAPGQSVQLNSSFLSGWAGNHFIWCGVSNGTGGLHLTIMDANSNVLAQTTAYIQIVDIKQMYERWTLGDQLSVAPLTNAILATDDGLPAGTPAFQYPPPQGTNTPYILFVHGWNMESWDKGRFAETAYKRLYWQGYRGRFGLFRWPTGNNFTGNFSQLISNPTEKDNYDSSEYNALLSGAGLLNKLATLDAEYSGHVYVLAHSMGNVVTGEALRLAGTNLVVNTYVASQAAVSAHTYDETVPNYSFNVVIGGVGFNFGPKTPNIYGDWFTGNNGGGAGRVISLYNTNDYALSQLHWQLDQLVKPDVLVVENGAPWNYEYGGSASDPAPWNSFFKTNDLTGATVSFNIVNTLTNRYEVMGYAAQSYTTALGATPNVENLTKSLNLISLWPSPDPLGNEYASHFYHSAQFRGDAVWEWNYWNSLLFSSQAGFNISNP